MSDSLSQVMLEFSANFESFDAALAQAEQRAARAGKNIERSLNTTGNVQTGNKTAPQQATRTQNTTNQTRQTSNTTAPGNKSVMTGRAVTAAQNTPNQTKIGFLRGTDPSVTKEGIATRRQAESLSKANIQAQTTAKREIVLGLKGINAANLGNQIKSLFISKVVAQPLDRGQAYIGTLLSDVGETLKASMVGVMDSLAVEIGAGLKADGQAADTTVADAFLRGASDGVAEAARVFSRELLENIGIYRPDKTQEGFMDRQQLGGSAPVRAAVSARKDYANIVAEDKELGRKQGVAKRRLNAFEKTDAYKDAAAVVAQMESERDLLLGELTKLSANVFEFGSAEYEQNVTAIEGVSSKIDQANSSITNKRKTDKTLVKRDTLVKDYNSITEDRNRVRSRAKAVTAYGQESAKQAETTSFKGLTQARDALTKELNAAKKELLNIEVPEGALSSLEDLSKEAKKVAKSIETGEAKQVAYKEQERDLQTGIDSLSSKPDQSPADRAVLDKAKTELKKIQTAKKISETALNKNKNRAKELDIVIGDLSSTIAKSGFFVAETKMKGLVAELMYVKEIISQRTIEQYPKLLQDIAKELNLQVSDLDQLPKIQALGGDQKDRSGQYEAATNTISIGENYLGELTRDIEDATPQFVQTLAHELTHAIQFAFGNIDAKAVMEGSAQIAKHVVKKASITEDEQKTVAPKLDRYVKAGANRAVLDYERDAHVSGLRVAKKAQVKKAAKEYDKNIKDTVKGLLATQATVTELLTQVNKSADGYEKLSEMVTQGVNAVAKKALDKKNDIASRASVALDLNPDAIVGEIQAVINDVSDFKQELVAQLKAVTESSQTLDKNENRKKDIRARLGQTTSGFKGAFSTNGGALTRTTAAAQTAVTTAVVRGSQAVGEALLSASRDVYQLATVAESAALTMLPFGQQIKGTTQALALMGAAVGVATSIPGGTQVAGLLLEGAQAVLAPAIDLAASGLGAAVGGTVEAAVSGTAGIITGAIAESGVTGAAMIAGALTSASASIAGAAGAGVGAAVTGGAGIALTAGAVAVPAVAATKAVAGGLNSLNGSQESRAYGKAMGQAAQAYLAESKLVKEKLKALAPAKGANKKELSASYSKQIFLLQGQIKAADEALESAKEDNAAMRLIKAARKNLVAQLKNRESAAKAKGIQVEAVIDTPGTNEPKMKRIRQVNNLDEAINAGKKGVKLAQDFKDGYTQFLDNSNDFWDAGYTATDSAIKGAKKGQDSASPSKKMMRLARDFRDGFTLAVNADNNFFAAGKIAATSAVKGFNRPLEESKDSGLSFTESVKASFLNSTASLSAVAKASATAIKQSFYNIFTAQASGGSTVFSDASTLLDEAMAKVESIENQLDRAETVIRQAEESFDDAVNGVGNRTISEPVASGARVAQAVVQGNGEALGVEVGAGAKAAKDAISSLLGGLGGVQVGQVGKFFDGFAKGFSASGKGALKLKATLVSVAAFAGFMMLRRQLAAFGKAMFDAQLNSEVLSKKLDTINLGGVNPFQKFGADAKAAGLSVQDYASAYAGMVSTMGKSLPNADKVFKDLTKGLNARGVVGESSTRALEALGQISSKGTVSMEELRQQLGEALPGAMSIAADSMGMTSGEFNKLVESGGLVASDFLPKFSRELNAVAGSDLPSLNSELVAAQSNIQGLLTAGGQDLPFTKALELFNGTVVAGSAIIQPMVTILSVALPAALLGTAFAALKAATAIKLVGSTLKFGGTVGLTVAALAVVIASVSHLTKEFGGLERSGAKARESLRNPIKASIELEGDVKSISIFNRIYDMLNKGRPAAERELQDMKNEFGKDANAIFDATLESGSLLKPEIIEKTKKDLEGLVAAQKANASELGNADALGYTSDQKKALLAEADRIQDAINERINLSLGDPAKINANLANVASKTAAIMQDGAARGLTEEETKVAYAGQLSILAKTGAMLKEQLRIHTAITESVNQQALARKEMNTTLELGTSVVDKKGVADTLAAYKELEGVTSTLAGFESRSMLIDIKTKEGSVDAITNQIATIDAFLATATASQSKVLSENFANGVKNATDQEIVDFKMRIEKGGFDYDAGVVAMVDALQKRSDLTRDLNQSNIDLIKANRELANALLDFEDARIGLEIKGNQAKVDFTTQANDLKKESDPTRNKEVIGANRELVDFGLQQEDSLRNMSVGFRSFTDSLNDAAYSLKDSIRNMSVEMKAVAIQMQQNSLNGINTFISAAGINDQLGLTKLLDAVSESIGIEGSNKKESILAEKANEERSTGRQVRDFSEQRDGLNLEADRAITELSRKIQDFDLDAIDIEVQAELSAEQIEIKSAQAEQQSRDLIRSASEFDDRALGFGQASLDIDKGGILDAYNKLQDALNLAAENPLAVQQALYDYNRAMKDEAAKVIGAIQDVKATGNANIGNKITEVQTLGKEKSALYDAQAAQEDARVAQELEINARKVDGVLVAIQRSVKTVSNDIVNQTGVLVNGVYEQFAQYGIGVLNPYEKIEKDLQKWGRNTKIELENQKREYKELLSILGEGGSTGDNTINVLAAVQNSSISQDKKDEVGAMLNNVRSNEDYVQLLKNVRGAISDLDGGIAKLSDDKVDKLADQAKAIQKAKDFLTRDNTLTTETAGLLESQDTSRLSRKDERKLQLAKASLKILQDFENKKAQITEDARNQPDLYGGAIALERENMALEEKNNLLKKAQKEASILSEIYAGMSSAGVDAIKTAILGVGEALLSNQPKEDAQRELQDDYANRLSDLVNNFEGSAEELQLAKDNLDGQRDDIQAEIDSKLSKTAQIFDVLKGALSGFAQSIAQVAAQMAATAAIKGIAGALGGGGGFGSLVGGLIGNAKDGAHVTAGISNYSMGGEVGSAIGLKNGIDAAMRREGAGAVPVVVTEGEQILSKRNGDAQLYRSLKAQGDWDNIKRANIGNYANGGSIGHPGAPSRLRGMGGGNSYSNTQVTIVAPNPESFHKSRAVIQREVQSSQDRVSRRGLA